MKNKLKKYLLIKLLFIFSIFLLFNFLVLLANAIGFKSLQQELVNHQVAKINKNYDVVFLGDSSLGHAINSNLWSELSDKPSLNMALTGNFSFAGAYAILEEIIDKKKEVKTLVIVNNVYAWQENIKYTGYEYIKKQNNFFLKYINYIDKNIFEIKNFYYQLIIKKNKKKFLNLIVNDFMKFGKKITKDANYTFEINLFNEDKSFYLKKIINLCSKFNIECFYFHGPIYENLCTELNFAFIKRINNELSDLGIKFDPNINCLNHDQIGDTVYHTSANYKNIMTKIYYEKYLKLKKN